MSSTGPVVHAEPSERPAILDGRGNPRKRIAALFVAAWSGALAAAGPWWKEAAPPLASSLGPRCLMASSSDPARGGVIVFGGGSRGASTLFNDIWIYDGVAWTRGPAAPPALTPRMGASLVYDAAAARHLLFGGFDGWWRSDTWELTAAGWSPLGATGAIPARAGQAMALDPRRDVTVLMGGYANGAWLSDVWELHGTEWRPGPAGPSARTLAAMVDHPARGCLVLFGGYDGSRGRYHDDTWELDASGWRSAPLPGPGPSARSSMGAVYDPDRELLVLYGGKDGATIFGETWTLDRDGWARGAESPDAMAPRVYMGMAHDAERGSIVVFGGFDFHLMMGDAWELGFGGPRSGIVAGPGAGPGSPAVVHGDSSFGEPRLHFAAFGSTDWGTMVAAGDLDGLAPDEIVAGAAPGPSFRPHVRAFSAGGEAIPGASFLAFGTMGHGLEVAAGDVEGVYRDAVVAGAGPGETFAPHVRGFALDGGVHSLAGLSFFAYSGLPHGVNAAAGDVVGLGHAQLVTAPGPGPSFAPAVRGFSWESGRVAMIGTMTFDAFVPPGHGGRVAAGDLDGDRHAEVVATGGPAPWRPARLVGFTHAGGAGMSLLPGCDVTPLPSLYGARSAVGELDLGPGEEILVAPGPDPAADARIAALRLRRGALAPLPSVTLDPFPGTSHGANVAAGELGW